MTEVIALIGDSNVNRHLDSAKAANPSDRSIRQSHLIVAFNAVQLKSALVSQNEHRKVVVLAALTNPITNFTFLGGDQLIIDLRLFLQQVCSWIQQGRNADDGTNQHVLILPPQFRRHPSWYRQYYTTIMAIFEEVFRAPGPSIWILPPFMDPEFEDDGYHYTSESGHLYIHHLIHSAHQILGATVKPDPVAQSHSSQLQGVRHEISEMRFKQVQITAKQEEEVDGRLNTEAENQFVISGLSITKLDSWQERQAAYVKATKDFLVKFCPALSSISIKFCRVITTSPRLFLNVECDSTESGIWVRKEWAKVVKSGVVKKNFPSISIVNSVTLGTRVRCSILKAYAKAFLQENPQGSASVTSFTSRPHFVFTASKTVRQNSLTFCQTILDDDLPLPSGLDLEQAYRIAGPKQYKGRLRDVFMILLDDYFNNKAQVVKETSQSQPVVEQMDTSNQKPSGSS